MISYTNPILKQEQQMKASEINHCKTNKGKVRRELLKRLNKLGFNYEAHSFGITVLIGGKMVFHGVESEIDNWLKELKELEQ